jgi:hypothetical protein
MTDENKYDKGSMLICLPWDVRPLHPGMPAHMKMQCVICRGYVCVNPITFASKGVPKNLQPVCGACALAIIDADGLENHSFQMTDVQKAGGGSPLVKAAVAAALKHADWPAEAVKRLRAQRDYYDASKSAPESEGAN